MTINTVTLTFDLANLVKAGQEATISLEPSMTVTDPTDELVIGQLWTSAQFTGTGSLAGIVANDNAQIQPAGWGYVVTVSVNNAVLDGFPYTTFINFANGATQDLSALTPVEPVTQMAAYMPLPSNAPAAGQVPAATGVGQASAWTTLTPTLVGADPAGAAATAQTNAETYAIANCVNVAGDTMSGPLTISTSGASGDLLQVTNTHSTPTGPAVQIEAQTAADQALGVINSSDTNQRFLITSDGKLNFGSGAAATDTQLIRSAAGLMQTTRLLLSTSAPGASVLTVKNSATPTTPGTQLTANAAGDQTLGLAVNTDTNMRLLVDSNGKHTWGSGSATGDADLYRASAGLLQTDQSFAATGYIQASRFLPSGITGATASSRYVGATTGGPPTSGTFLLGDYVVDQTGAFWICYTAGSPGLWTASGGADYWTTNGLNPGESSMPRFYIGSTATLTSGQVYLSYWTAIRTEVCNVIYSQSESTAAGATPTYAAVGVYSVAANGNLTLVAQCANTTSLYASTFTLYNPSLLSAWTKQAGQRYAFATLIVSAAAMPSLAGNNGTDVMTNLAPRVCGVIPGQSTLPASVAAASVNSANQMVFGAVTP